MDSVLGAPYTRRNLGGMAASDPVLVSYRKAIKAMKLLDYHNPLSWDYQAAIHGTTLSDALTAWNTCEHGSPYFWSWHRMYLYWFERIIRKMSGDSSWSLPYWDYSAPAQRFLPPPFRDPSSELYLANRGLGWNDGLASYLPTHVDPTGGNIFVDYFSAQSALESNPHDNVHIDMGGLMGHVITAAGDPVFYVHHSNIDRLWNLWVAQGGGRVDPLNTADWKTKSYAFFDENGKQINMTTCEILRAAEQLNYSYESEPPQVKEYCLRKIPFRIYLFKEPLIHWPGPPVELKQEAVSVEVSIKEFRQRLSRLVESKTDILLLELENVEAESSPEVVWDVYLGPATAETGPGSPFFVGTVGLFSAGIRSRTHGEFKPAHFTFPVNRAIAASLRTDTEHLRLLFAPSGPIVDGKPSRPKVKATVRIGSINLSVGRENQGKRGNHQQAPEKPQV